MTLRIPPEVAHRLGYYVYLYVDPRNGRPFYVGKGRGKRILVHLSAVGESRKIRTITELNELGLEPRLDVLAHGLPDEMTALRIEAAAIDLLGLDDLTNEVRGWRSIQMGRMSLSDLMIYYAAKAVVVTAPTLLIRINKLYRHGMSDVALYEATRGVWRVGSRREGARYAFAVFEGVVREVYVIETWHPAATTVYSTRDRGEMSTKARWEFIGRIAPARVRNRYFGRSVAAYFKRGQRHPVVYVNC
jgi:hypothetical protein